MNNNIKNRKSQQAAQKKEPKRKAFFLFANIEQFVGFLFFILVILLSFWAVNAVKMWINNPERVVLSQLILTGDNQLTHEDDIRQAILELGLPNTYISQDVDDIQQEILRLSWIKQVSVRKQWPDRLIIHLVEYRPRYFWNDLYLLDEDANLFSVPKERILDTNMPKLYGPVGREQFILETYHQLAAVSKQLANNTLTLSIRVAIADERNAWTLIVTPCVNYFCLENQDIKLNLGRENKTKRYERFIRFFSDIQANLAENERLTEVDLRYENGISVKKQKIDQ